MNIQNSINGNQALAELEESQKRLKAMEKTKKKFLTQRLPFGKFRIYKFEKHKFYRLKK